MLTLTLLVLDDKTVSSAPSILLDLNDFSKNDIKLKVVLSLFFLEIGILNFVPSAKILLSSL